ncbi:MAG: UPF0175 family protein [Bacteroidota bacterium]
MSIVITDDILRLANMPESEFKLELALYMYAKGILTLGKASEFAGIPKIIFQKELGKNDLTVSYDREEFEKDLVTIKKHKSD